MIKWFDMVGTEDFQQVGGKGFNLSKMYREGIKVPNGFIVLSGGYDAYIEANNLNKEIDDILKSNNDTAKVSQLIKELFRVDLMQSQLKTTIINAFKKIPSGRVAVRSSSTVEDLPGMSFAGQYSSYLNVQEDDLLEKVVQCWQSLWNERAIEYRKRYQINNQFSHAVVIQEMINSKISGVAFTANPINGIRNQLVVNASYGLGEAIVSGEVNPDQFTIDKTTGELVKTEISKKEVMYKYAKQGIEIIHLDDVTSKKISLENHHLSQLVKACNQTEDYFGKPQDIEFAFDDNDNLYIIQSRDITTLFPIDTLDQDGKLRAYMGAGTVLFGMKEPFTPLGFDIMSQMFPTIINIMTQQKKPLSNNFVKYVGSRMYIDITYLLASKFVAKQFANAFSGNDLPLKDVMYSVIDKYSKVFTKQGIKFKIPFGVMKYSLSMMKPMTAIRKIPNEQKYDAMIELGNQVYNEQYKKFQSLRTNQEKLEFTDEAMKAAFMLSQSQSLYCIEFNNITKIKKKLNKMYGSRFDPEILIHSLPRCFSQELTIKLNLLAKYYDENGLEPSADDPKFIEVLERFGHRGNTELDFGTPRWREDPSYLLNQVKSYMDNKMYERNLLDIEQKRLRAEEFIEEVYSTVKKDYGLNKAKKFKELMINYRIAAGMREYPKSDIVRIMQLGRKAILSIGESFESEGLIDSKYDVFFLRKEDIINQKNLGGIIKSNKEYYSKEMGRNAIPRLILNNGETFYSSTSIDPNSKTITGMPLSPGIYEGIIRVVYDPLKTELKEGEIMVTESTNPAWTPLFATAGALIMEYGGPMSHGGVVAREYGLPAVVGISSATQILKDCQRVKVNGETGIIELLD